MSLRTRVGVPIVALALGIVVALSLVNLYALADAEFNHVLANARTAAVQAQQLVTNRVNEQTRLLAPPPEQVISVWLDLIEQDAGIHQGLQDVMAAASSVVEIAVATPSGKALAATNPARVGRRLPEWPPLEEWRQLPLWRKARDLFFTASDYEVALPLGYEGKTVLVIKVVASTRLLGDAMEKQFYPLGLVSLAALLISLALSVFVANLALRPLQGISEALDRIARGERSAAVAEPEPDTEEVKALQSKLNTLGQQFRGARADADELRQNVERLLDRLEEAVLLFDRDHRLVMAGGAAERFLGMGRWLLVGRSVEEIFPAGTPLGDAVQVAVETRSPLRDFRARALSDGARGVPVAVNVEPLESVAGREYLGALITLRDAETRRQLETQLEVSTRLAAINRLTGGVAHEIKNPLNAITLHLEILREKLRDHGEDVEEELEVISREIQRLDRVVKTFLDFTRPVELHFSALNLGEILEETATLAATVARSRGQRVECTLPEERLLINADRDLVKQALLNIAINGLEAMEAGGVLTLSLARDGEFAVAEIRDQGCGIAPDIRQKIFHLYFTTKPQGSGIGLAMTYRVVQLHNATIDVSSEPGAGTVFRLRFPLLSAMPQEDLPLGASMAQPGGAGDTRGVER